MAFPMEFRMDFLKNFSLICKIPTGENKKVKKQRINMDSNIAFTNIKEPQLE